MNEYNLKMELRRLKEKVDELEQTTEKDRYVIAKLLQISESLLDYINDTAKHVIQLERKDEKMKDIIYGDVHQGLLGVEDLGDGYKLAVVNIGGTHHCAYVQFPGVENIGSYDDIHVDAHVHGGFTFLGSLSKYGLEGVWLGWDYTGEKMWTTAEVVEEGLDILKAIKDGKWRKGTKMLSIKEIFDICKEHGVFVDLCYQDNPYAGIYYYMIKLYYGRKRHYGMLDQRDLEYIFACRESFEKYVCDFISEMVMEKEDVV